MPNLEPDKIYLHAGTREVTNALLGQANIARHDIIIDGRYSERNPKQLASSV
jgi:hypothetical protein